MARRRRWSIALQIAGTLAALAWVATMVDLDALGGAVRRVPAGWFAAATAAILGNVLIGALRWHVLLRTYGATRIPPARRLLVLYGIAFFYNNCLPGAVTGDLVRGVASRESFDDPGATGAITVVLVERVLGLAALFLLLGLGLLGADGAVDRGSYAAWALLGLAASAAAVALVPLARRLGAGLGGRAGEIARALPQMRAPAGFALAFALSIATQALVVLAGYLLLAALAPQVTPAQALLIVPLAAATAFLPITVGGAGAREAAFVALAAAVAGVPAADALAASLALWAAHLAVALLGGAVPGVIRLGAWAGRSRAS